MRNVTTGQIYSQVIARERRGEFLGDTVQVIPHITDEIKAVIREAAGGADILIVEVGGTVGDIESLPFLEAIRQMKYDVGEENALYVHLTLVPFIAAAGDDLAGAAAGAELLRRVLHGVPEGLLAVGARDSAVSAIEAVRWPIDSDAR